MFDYQAGEKYKLTLIMVGVAGLLAGIFLTMLLMPTESPASARRQRVMTAAMTDPDVTGGRGPSNYGVSQQAASALPGQQQQPPAQMVDRVAARVFMDNWLPRVWDLGAATAMQSQESAISAMTPSCAGAYRQNIWTATLAKQVQESGLRSQFQPQTVDVSENLQDGSCVVKVKGVQVLSAASGQQKSRQINVEYMVIQTQEGMRIAGISEGGQSR